MEINQKPFGQISSSIGPLSLFEITAADQVALYKELGKRVDLCGPEEYVRRLARYICFPTNQLPKRTAQAGGPAFTMSEIEDLSEVDMEVFSTLYIQNNPYLYRQFESEKIKGADGNPIVSWKLGDMLYPKGDSESFVQYLHRLAGFKQARELEQAEKQATQEKLLREQAERQAVEEKLRAAAQTQPPARPEKVIDWAHLFSRPLSWFRIILTLISVSSLAVSLHVLSLARYIPAASQKLPTGDISMNINLELDSIAELLNSLQEAQTNGSETRATPEGPVANTEQIFQDLQEDGQPSSP